MWMTYIEGRGEHDVAWLYELRPLALLQSVTPTFETMPDR